MASSSSEILLQVLLRPEWRSDEGVERVRTALRELGIDATGSGRASLSVRVGSRAFTKLFGRSAARGAGASKAATSAGAAPLAVPPSLDSYVQSVTVAPRHVYFAKKAPRRDKGGSG